MQRKVHYEGVLPWERGRSIILSKDRRVRQRWRRSRRGRRASERSRKGSEDLRGGDSEADGIKPPYRDLRSKSQSEIEFIISKSNS
jgi:hypothetical protein